LLGLYHQLCLASNDENLPKGIGEKKTEEEKVVVEITKISDLNQSSGLN
jgi:hypothetical protein